MTDTTARKLNEVAASAGAPARHRSAARLLNSSRSLGLLLVAPAVTLVTVFFLVPVVMTAVFAFTNMSTATGISGGAYQIAPGSLNSLKGQWPDLAARLAEPKYIVDEEGLAAVEELGLRGGIAEELRTSFLGEVFGDRRSFEREVKALEARPTTRQVKQISELFNRSVINLRFESQEALLAALDRFGYALSDEERTAITEVSYSGWVWTTRNIERLFTDSDNLRIALNTAFYVATVLFLFNIPFALILAIGTHYMPEAPAGIFRSLWLLPRVSPPVIYVLMWKWLAWDTGFISMILAPWGVPPRNWMMDSTANAWLFVFLINGFVGASMGMLVFSSALKAIPQTQFWASEIDGASRWQQIRYILLPQLRWPILFVTCYQTLSLLASFEYIFLATDGGPGGTTEVWSLAAFNQALNNYSGHLQYGYGAAMALVLVLVGIVLALVYLRLFNYRTLLTRPLIER
jgi:inositol-phosphate transport system permease protein